MQTLQQGFVNDTAVPASLCARCLGTRFLCGKPVCPIMVRYYAYQSSKTFLESKEIDGLSPPGVFIGRYGYPNVNIGPFIAPSDEQISILDAPEAWVGKSIDEITSMRFSMVRAKSRVNVQQQENKIFSLVQEIALSKSAPELEVTFRKPPRASITLDENVQPFGPSGVVERLRAYTGGFDDKMEKLYHDTDADATTAVLELYRKGVPVSSIQRGFSAGCFGVGRKRRMVPTRWSITAVDDILGRSMLNENKQNPVIDEWRIYKLEALSNRWVVLMLPTSWRYELIEAWYPNTTWNPTGRQISIVSSHEFFNGRREYAEIGGCYYAARLAVNELMRREHFQAGVVILREAHPGYIMPVGVWNVREHVRLALKGKPDILGSFSECKSVIEHFLDIPFSRWAAESGVLKDMLVQRRVEDFIQSLS
ncbi:MAG: Nre family DNA repair protein [Methanomassiliicoccales archaeon]